MKVGVNQMQNEIEINWQPDASQPMPVYQQIINYCVDRIQSGDWLIGQQLPAQRQLAKQFGVNRSTISKAIAELLADGVLTTAFGGGTRVASNSWSTMMTQSPVNWQDYMMSGEFEANQPVIQQINDFEDHAKIRLSTGEIGPDLFPKQLVQRAMVAAAERITNLNYLPPMGLDRLREALVTRLAKWGITTTADNILITSGSLQSLQLIAVSLLEQGATVYTTPASYLRSLRVLQSVHAQFKSLPVDTEGLQYWHIPATGGQRLLYTIPTFDNPSSLVMSAQRRQDLLQFAKAHQLPIIEDTAYQELWLDERPPQPLKALDDTGNVLYLGSISKTLAPGMRIGWIVGPASIIKRLSDVKMQTDYGASSLSQLVLVELLNDPNYDQYLTDLRAALRQRRTNAITTLQRELGGIAKWQTPQGGFYIWVTLPETVNVQQVFTEAAKQGILVNPGAVYGASATHSLRLSYAYATEAAFSQGLHQVAALIKQQLPA